MNEEPIVTINTNRTFTYKDGDISLSFTINVDDSVSTEKFLNILCLAKDDLEKQLSILKAPK